MKRLVLHFERPKKNECRTMLRTWYVRTDTVTLYELYTQRLISGNAVVQSTQSNVLALGFYFLLSQQQQNALDAQQYKYVWIKRTHQKKKQNMMYLTVHLFYTKCSF